MTQPLCVGFGGGAGGAVDQLNNFSLRKDAAGALSSNESDIDGDDDANSDSAMTTLPIGERSHQSVANRASSSLGGAVADYFERSAAGGSLQRQTMAATAAKVHYLNGKQAHYSPRQMASHNNNVLTIDATTGLPVMSGGGDADHPMSGRSTFAFWTIVIIMFVLALGNLALTVSIVGVLRIGRGMEYMELVPEADTIKFYGETYLERVYKRDGHIEGFADVPVSITGDNSAVHVGLLNDKGHPHNSMLLSKNGTTLHGFAALVLRNPATGAPIFSTHRPHFTLASATDNLRAKAISTARLSAAIGASLHVNHTRAGKVVFRGTEGVRLQAAAIQLAADQNVWLHSLNGTLTLRAANGAVHVDVASMPVVGENGVRLAEASQHYKLCVCMPQGRVFRVPVTQVAAAQAIKGGLCAYFGEETNPCA